MDDFDAFERSLAAALRSDADLSVGRFEPGAIASTAVAGTQRHPRRIPWGFGATRATSRWPVAAAFLISVLVIAGAFYLYDRNQSLVVANPSPTPTSETSPSLPAVVAPDPSPSTTAPTVPGFPRAAGVWIPTGSMLTPRSGHTAVRLLDGRVLVAGGVPGNEPDLAVTSAELYDPTSGTWSGTGNMLRPNGGFEATLLHDGTVLVGDVDNPAADNPVFGAEVYDPASGTWAATGRMVTPDKGSAVLLLDGTVLVVHQFGSSELYHPDSRTWTATGQMIEPFHQSLATVLMADGKVLEVGGNNGTAYVGVAAELYDPGTGTWTATSNMHSPMEVVSATLLPGGRALVMDLGFITLQSPELYDPATESWTVAGGPGMNYRSAALLPDGTVLVAGAPNSPEAALYDPGTGSWSSTGSMLQAHSSPLPMPLTVLLDGTVLVSGGSSAAAELYVPAGVTPPSGLPGHPPLTPTPIPTQVPPQAGPDGSWKITVSNSSTQPARLFVAEETEQGLMGQRVGSATPSVVLPGTTVDVTFMVPARGVNGWSIFVTSGPNTRGVIGWTDVPPSGSIHVNEEGLAGFMGES